MRRPLGAVLLLGVLLPLVVGFCGVACQRSSGTEQARTPTTSPHSVRDPIPEVPAGSLPAEARQTLRLIDAGGPFPYEKDGTIFRNREGRLPQEPRGYYREYTVPTPRSADRGARRIITGKSGERYYTSDHYRTFVRVVDP